MIILIIVILTLFIGVIVPYLMYYNFEPAIEAVKRYNKALENGNINDIINLYCREDSYLMTNDTGPMENLVYPMKYKNNDIPVGQFISGDNLREYYSYKFKNSQIFDVKIKVIKEYL